jgi:YVTN family beta-propeller protein
VRSLHLQAVASLLLALALCASGCGDNKDESDGGAAANGGGQHVDYVDGRTRIYVTLAGKDEVLVLDEHTHETLGHIPVGKGPAILLATPDGKQLYTANWAGNSVSAIDVATEQSVEIKMHGRPYVIAMAPEGDVVYAGLNANEIAVIDTKTKKVARTITMNALPASIIVSPDGATLYVATLGSGSGSLLDMLMPGRLFSIDAKTGGMKDDKLMVGQAPAWITISPDGSKVYTLNFLSDDVTVVDTKSWKIDATISTGSGSQAIIGNVTPDGALLYVTNHGTGELAAIDTKTNTLVKHVKLTGRPVGVNFNADGTRVYVGDFGAESLSKPADTNYLLTGQLTATGDGTVSVYDTASDALVGEKITVGPGPTSIVVLQ